MKLGKFSLAIASTVVALTASAQVYNTGYNTSVVGGKLVDNLWQITSIVNPATGSGPFPAIPYSAFVLPSPLTWPWDYSAPPVGAPNNFVTQWDSSQFPAFAGVDNNATVTTYTLNFNAPAAGKYSLYFEADNYVDMFLGAAALPFYTEQPAHNGTDFVGWQSTTVNAVAGANQLRIVVYDYPLLDTPGNYTGLRVNFGIPQVVPEPSTFALAAGGLIALLGAVKRRK
jgi:hypothetical protein